MKREQPNSFNRSGVRDREAFTLIELLMVISVIAILASFMVGLAKVATLKMKESRIRAELNQLVTAIESYHAKHGFYPPDNRNPYDRTVNSVTNGLFYELSGVVLTNADTAFITKNGSERVTVAGARDYLHNRGFANSSRDASEVRSFFNPKERQIGQISDDPDVDVLIVPVEWPLNRGFEVPFKDLAPKFQKLNPWRYDASSTNRHNLKSFDLWAEYVVGNELKVIGNWKE